MVARLGLPREINGVDDIGPVFWNRPGAVRRARN